MAVFKFVIVLVAAAVVKNARAITEGEVDYIKTKLLPIVQGCAEENDVSAETLESATKAYDVDAVDPCFLACVFKKTKFMDDYGQFDVVSAEEIIKSYLSSEADQKKAFDYVESCASVNDETVSDGYKGCERAKLLTKCLIEKKQSSRSDVYG